jgi:hypothetical protein
MTTISTFRQIENNLPNALQRVSDDPQVKRDSDYYLANIGNIKSIDDFMANDRIYRYALTAFGLDDMAYAKAFIRKALTEGVDDQNSFANRLADPRFKDLVENFNFARYGDSATVFTRTQQGTVDRYVRQTLEVQAGADNEGVRLALYFQRNAPSATTPYSLLADKALLKVTQVALGLPEASGALDISHQADKLLTRFTALWDIDNAPPSPILGIFGDTSGGAGIGADLLGQIQKTLR